MTVDLAWVDEWQGIGEYRETSAKPMSKSLTQLSARLPFARLPLPSPLKL